MAQIVKCKKKNVLNKIERKGIWKGIASFLKRMAQ